MSSRRSRPSAGRSSSAQASSSRRKTASAAYSRRPMSRCWAPCPGKRKATRGRARSPATTALPSPGSAASAWRAPAALAHTQAARCGNARRPVCRVWATSASSASGCASSHADSRPAAAASALSLRAETASSCQGREAPGGGGGGASSSTRWALAPPRPKELTPARRGPGSRRQGPRLRLT